MEPGSQPKLSARHISQLLCSSVTSQVLLHFLRLEWAKNSQVQSEAMGRQPNPSQWGQEVHYSCSKPESSMAKLCYFYCTLQVRKRCYHLWFWILLQKKILTSKEHVLNGCFPVPWPSGELTSHSSDLEIKTGKAKLKSKWSSAVDSYQLH